MSATPANAIKADITAAFQRFGQTRSLSEANEAETRCELVDVILGAIGWPPGSFSREVATATGDYVDYELPRERPAAMVIEAKRSGGAFALDHEPLEKGSRTRALSSLRSNGGSGLRDALKQAAGYCNDRAIPYACITNGYQWIFFRGLSTDDNKWTDGRAVVFPTPDSLLANIDVFLQCVSPVSITTSQLPRLLSQPTRGELAASRRPIDHLTFRSTSPGDSGIAARREIGRMLFAHIHGGDRAELLNSCYVEPGVLPEFDNSLRRLLSDTLGTLPGVERVDDGGASKFVDELRELEEAGTLRSPVLVVGNVGVGKTTFLHKALAELRANRSDADAAAQAMFAYVDLENRGEITSFDDREVKDEVAAMALERLAASAESVLKHRTDISEKARAEANPDRDVTIRTMLRKDLEREKSVGDAYFSANPTQWVATEYQLIRKHRDRKLEFLIHYVRHLRARFRRPDGLKYPILIILDNLDQASPEFQRCIYALGLRLAKETPTVVVVSIREDTFHQGREKDGFLTSSSLELVFHVRAPALDKLLKQRVKYAEWARENDRLPSSLRSCTEEVDSVLDVVSRGLLAPPVGGLEVLSSLAGHDTRTALKLVREYVVGAARVPRKVDPSVDFMLEALLANRGGAELPIGIANIFDASPFVPPLHALRSRLLAYYSWAFGKHPERGIHEVTELAIWRFAAWGYPPECVEEALSDLCAQGLLSDGGRSVGSANVLPARLTITATGHAHIARLLTEPSFRTAEALFTRWYDKGLAEAFVRQAAAAGTDEGTSLGDIVASGAVRLFDGYLAACLAREDASLSESIEQQVWARETISRSSGMQRRARAHSAVSDRPPPLQIALVDDGRQSLPRIPASLVVADTVWLPRILWALEFARCNQMGPLTAAQIARVLAKHGDMDVPAPNVARAFREFAKRPDVTGYFERNGKRYSISSAGAAVIAALIAQEHGAVAVSSPASAGARANDD